MSAQLNPIMDWIKARIKKKAYFNSEHMVRYLTQRIFTISEIGTVHAEGIILETHSHSLRNDCYLILAYPDNKPIHVRINQDPAHDFGRCA